ncbi:MAG: proline--tRNA ligase, partial [Prochlorococcus sp.]|nr:proline--tRNA ligase [Prochlorococcus sp.]
MSKRPVWDTFPGAWYTIGIDVIMPNGRTLQVASVHHYKDQWARAFDLKYADENGEHQYCHQTTYGMSERLLGAVVGIHGDDNGLIFPPLVAPIQVVIMPVAAHKNPLVDEIVESVSQTLRESGFRIKIDNRDLRPGQKYWDWEIKGVPLRLEIGPRDVENGNAFAARRTGGKEPIPLDDITNQVRTQLDIVENEL